MASRYSNLQFHWEGTVGVAVRALLDLKNDTGGWLWFHDALKNAALADDGDTLNAGRVVATMLQYKLQHGYEDTPAYRQAHPEA